MTERSIFLGALDRTNPAERAAYLDATCAGKPGLRQRIEELLRSHHEAGTFLDVPALEQLAAAEQSLTFLEASAEPGTLGRLDHYEVLEAVGRGGTGMVLKARDTKLQRVVAIKVLASRLATSDCARRRFVREAQAAAAVRDDHVVAIHAVRDDGSVPYLVMEYIDGTTLQERISRAGPLELREVLRIGSQLARGLAAAHSQGLVHRDIKPANVLLENGVQRVKITDFGLAGAAAGSGEGGAVVGTPLYMSPEQARGESTDARSDLFSLGSVLYAMCAGRPAFQADTTAAVLKRVSEETAVPVRVVRPDLPAWLGAAIDRLLAREARDRFASAQDVADLLNARLAELQQGLLPAPGEESAAGSANSVSPRKGLVVAACLGTLVIALAAAAYLMKPWHPDSPSQGPGAGPLPVDTSRGPLDLLREDIPPRLLTLAGGVGPAQAPPELAAVLGDGRFLLPRVGQTAWMRQSPDGKVLAVPLDEDLVLFEAATGGYLRSLKGPGGRAFFVAFSPDSRLLAVTTRYESSGGSVRVWDLGESRVLYTYPQPGPTISCAATFSPDGKLLITEGDGRIHVRDARSGRQVQTLAMPPGGISALAFSPDGRRLAVANWHGNRVKLFDWTGSQFTDAGAELPHPWPASVAVYSPDGKFLASSDLTGMKLWDARTLKQVWAVETAAQQMAFSPDGQTLFAATTIEQHRPVHTFTRWDLTARKGLSPLSVEVSVEPVRAFHCLNRDGKVLFVAPQHGATYVRAVDATTGKEQFPRRGHVSSLNTVAVSPDGRTVASAGEDWTIKVWDLATGRVRHSLSGHTGAVCGLAFSPDGQQLASGSRDGTIGLWDVASGSEIRALHGHARSFTRIAFRPDGRTLAAGGEGGVIKLWDVDAGKEGRSLSGHTGIVLCVAFSPDGTLLASGGEDGIVRLQDLATGAARTFTAAQAVSDVAFAPDGRTLAAVGDAPKSALRLWDLETGRETTWPVGGGHLRGLAFATAGSLLATGAEDGTVRLWDRNGKRERTIGPGPFGGAVRSVAFTPDGRYLATANANGTVYLLRVGTVPARR